MKPSLLYLIMAFVAVLVLPAAISSQADDVRGTIGDHLPGNATATLSINASGMDAGTYAFAITASDGHNIERAVYAVVVR